jgi:predicted anti-sigma-YlaC factor YlaD
VNDVEKEEKTMNCEQALILISAALDGEITQSEREQLNSHLDLCAECRSIAEDFGLMSAALAEETELPAGLTERMEEALRSAD